MKHAIKKSAGYYVRKYVGVAILAFVVAATGLVVSLTSGASAVQPPYEPDPTSSGTVTLYDASGNVVTGGKIGDSPIAAYAVGSATVVTGDNTADLFLFKADSTLNPGLWLGDQLAAFTSYPLKTGPANIVSASATLPTFTGSAGDESISDFIASNGSSANDPKATYQNLYQIRMRTAHGSAQSTSYDVADLLVDPATGTFQVVYPAPAVVTTPTTPSTTPTGPSSTPTTPSTTPTGPSSTPTTPSTTPTGPSSTPTTPSTTPTGPSSTPTTPSTTPTGPSSTPTTPSTTPTGPSSTPSTTPTGPSSTPTTPSTTPTGPSSTPTTPTGPSSTPTTPSTTPTGPSSTPTTPSTTPTDPSTTPTTPSSTSSAATAGTIGATDVNGNPLSPGFTATPGESIQLTASGLTANAPYTIVLHSTPVTLASVISSASGTATFTMVVPAAIASGAHTVQFVAADGTIGATMSFSVAAVSNAAATSPLANTGTNSRLPIELALLFIASGGLLLVAVRRRPRGKHLS